MTKPDTSSSSRAEELFDDYARRRDGGEVTDFEALCGAHPDLVVELRSLLAADRVLDQLLPTPLDQVEQSQTTPSELLRKLRTEASRGRRYKTLGEIGRGGMGVVLSVWDEELRRKLAMKVMRGPANGGYPEAGASDPTLLSRFLEEAQVTSQLDHPGIVPVHEIGVGVEGSIYYTMRLVHGDSLHTIFQRVRDGVEEWSLARAIGVLLKVCDAMNYVHTKGVIHRDLKPQNVMVGKFGEVYVMDWGVARVVGHTDSHDLRIKDDAGAQDGSVETERQQERESSCDSPLMTMGGQVLGTPAYMSPEQARGEVAEMGPRSDVYSVGAMLYELVSGRMPFAAAGESPSSRVVLERLKRGPPAPLDESERAAPAELAAICNKAMARAAADRYADMRALSDDLRAYVEGRVVGAYETGTWAETSKWVRRNKALAASLSSILAIVVAALAWGAYQYTTAAQRKEVAQWNDVFTTASALAQFRHDSSEYGAGIRSTSATEWWFTTADRFLAGDPGGARGTPRPRGLREYREILLEVRKKGRPLPDRERAAEEDLRILTDALERKRADLAWRSRMLEQEPFPREADVDAALRATSLPASAEDLNRAAFDLIGPNTPRIFFGREVEAVCLARRAVYAAPDYYWRARCLDTLAWALCRVGAFEEARRRQDEAVAQARLGLERAQEQDRKKLRDILWNIEANRANQIREIGCWIGGEEANLFPSRRSELAALEEEVRTWNRWQFDDHETAFRHEVLTRLVRDLNTLEGQVTKAREATETPQAQAIWAKAIARIYEAPRYASLGVITPQLGLVPLEPDPESGLWEFAHVASGVPPQRIENRLFLTRNSGMVFVLLPGTRVSGGGNPTDESSVLIEIDPFFVSKYEMTEAQWSRLAGRSELDHPEDHALDPNVGVSWHECAELMRSAGGWLHFPRDVQWDYACFAGAKTRFCTGDSADSLKGAANLKFDAYVYGAGTPTFVGTFRANQFGLHDVHGNAAEWCQNLFAFPRTATSRPNRIGETRVVRSEPAAWTPTYLDGSEYEPKGRGQRASLPDEQIGLRPARWLTR